MAARPWVWQVRNCKPEASRSTPPPSWTPPSSAHPARPRMQTRPVTPKCTKPARGPAAVLRNEATPPEPINESNAKARLTQVVRKKSRTKSSILARVEPVFGVVKRLRGFGKVRYREGGLRKNITRGIHSPDSGQHLPGSKDVDGTGASMRAQSGRRARAMGLSEPQIWPKSDRNHRSVCNTDMYRFKNKACSA